MIKSYLSLVGGLTAIALSVPAQSADKRMVSGRYGGELHLASQALRTNKNACSHALEIRLLNSDGSYRNVNSSPEAVYNINADFTFFHNVDDCIENVNGKSYLEFDSGDSTLELYYRFVGDLGSSSSGELKEVKLVHNGQELRQSHRILPSGAQPNMAHVDLSEIAPDWLDEGINAVEIYDKAAEKGVTAATPESLTDPGDGNRQSAFRTVCFPSAFEEYDPILKWQNDLSAMRHLHMFFGNTAVSPYMTTSEPDFSAGPYEVEVDREGNSTCWGGLMNGSAYWAPALLYTEGDVAGQPVMPDKIDVYYKSGRYGTKFQEGDTFDKVRNEEGIDNGLDWPNGDTVEVDKAYEVIQPFPKGLRMIAGDATASPSNDSIFENDGTYPNAPDRHYWECRDSNGDLLKLPYLTNDCSTNKIALVVTFPQCWDGKNLWYEDGDPHMIYADNTDGCPLDKYPVVLPQLSYKISYSLPESTNIERLRLSSDMYEDRQYMIDGQYRYANGMSIHADYINGWRSVDYNDDGSARYIMEMFVTNCLNAGVDCHSDLLGEGYAARDRVPEGFNPDNI